MKQIEEEEEGRREGEGLNGVMGAQRAARRLI